MRDKELSELYDLEIKRLKVEVRKNVKQFPTNFMNEINNEELSNWRLQSANSRQWPLGILHMFNFPQKFFSRNLSIHKNKK